MAADAAAGCGERTMNEEQLEEIRKAERRMTALTWVICILFTLNAIAYALTLWLGGHR